MGFWRPHPSGLRRWCLISLKDNQSLILDILRLTIFTSNKYGIYWTEAASEVIKLFTFEASAA